MENDHITLDFIFIFAIRMCRMQFHPHRIFMIRFCFECPLFYTQSHRMYSKPPSKREIPNAFAVIKVCVHTLKKSITCINMTTFACSVSYSLSLKLCNVVLFFQCLGSSSHLSCHALLSVMYIGSNTFVKY